jgi:hypothetical protein
MNIATYFPFPHHLHDLPPQSLLNRITQWLTKATDSRTPLQYLEQTISNWITEHTLASASNSVLVSGDFNATWSDKTTVNSIYSWATTNQLSNPSIEHRKYINDTHTDKPDQPQRVIDHTLVRSSLLVPLSCTTIHGDEWHTYSDHKFLLIRFRNHHTPVPHTSPEPPLPTTAPTDLNLSNPYSKIVQNWVSSTKHLATEDPLAYLSSLTHISNLALYLSISPVFLFLFDL